MFGRIKQPLMATLLAGLLATAPAQAYDVYVFSNLDEIMTGGVR
jgi:uncharacterized PurR-regulated membrane protein YhhQ (DUF165 family)